MRCLVILFLLPFVAFAQIGNEDWTTPIADVKFEDGKIAFTVAGLSEICPLTPQFLMEDEFTISYDPMLRMNCSKARSVINNLAAYLENPGNLSSCNLQIKYIKAFALQCYLALTGEKMPSAVAFDKVRQMRENPEQEISGNAKIALRFYSNVEKSLHGQFKRADYLESDGSGKINIEHFSPDRLFFPNPINEGSQKPDSIVWPKYYSKENTSSYSDDIIETYDGGYMISGNYYSYDGTDFKQWSWLIKTNINGNILWDKVIEGGDEYVRTNITQTKDGGILTCGAIWSVAGQWEPYVMKLNNCGEKEWCKVFTGSVKDNPWAEDIFELSNEEIFVLVNQWGTGTVEDLYLFKLSSIGDVLWKKPVCSGIIHPQSAIAIGRSIEETNQSKYLITGSVYWENPWDPGGTKGLRSLFVMIDSSGTEQWVLPFGLNDTILGNAHHSIQIGENDFIGVGRAVGQEVSREGIIMRFDSIGNEIDYKRFNFQQLDPIYESGLFIDILKRDSVYIIASGFGLTETSPAHPGEIVVDTNQFFTNFSVLDYIYYDQNDDPYSVLMTKDSKLLSNSSIDLNDQLDIYLTKLNSNLEPDTAYTGNYTYDSLCTTPGLPQSGFIYLDECDIITGEEIPSPEEYYTSIATIPITAYPNPAETEITLAYENTEHHNNMLLECYNIYGQKVHSEMIWKGQQQTRLDVSGWAKGLYMAVVKSNGKLAGTERFVIR